ncbi:BON domain-containing protein [Calothrix sp. CCY 0018]|uniref:BON domain-containing protein n=1 Tax=Calothrix sp. CCY 0018 TaxID=3103864 RepID=UPI0039C71217
MSLLNLLTILFLTVTIVVSFSLLQRKYSFASTIALLSIVIFTYSFNNLPALATPNLAALGARDSAIHEPQQSMEEDLKLTPGGGHYSGIEYSDSARNAENQPPVSDETILESIEPYTNDNLIVSVTNGAVKLSGRVENKEVARHVVEEIKEIPGVHEITFDIGLENKAL